MADYSLLRYTSSDGLVLAARDYAGAPGPARLPVICIHGLTRNAADFDEVAPLLAQQSRRVLAVDIRGRGDSARDPNPAHYNPVTYAGDVAKLRWLMACALLMLLNSDEPNSPLASSPCPNCELIASATTIAVRPRSFMAGASTSSR